MIIKIQSNKQKARSLKEMAEITLKRLKEIDLKRYPTNTLTDYYDIIRKLIEALTSVEGIKVKGEGAHQEIIDYICKKYSFSESARQFLQELRDYRNRVSYEGFMVKSIYIESNCKRIEEIINKLLELLNNIL